MRGSTAWSAPGSRPRARSRRAQATWSRRSGRASTAVQAQGYTPNTLLIDAAGAESLDLFRTGGTLDYAFVAGRFAPGQVFGLDVRVTKAAGTAVVDANSYGKLHVSPLSLARFEQDAGSTNKSTVRLEGHAAFGTERTAAAARINP